MPPKPAFRLFAVSLLVASAALLPPAERAARAQTADRPNILIIMTDDQRTPGTLGVMPEVTGRFVKAGTEFTQAFATTPLCCPSRASLMTGQYAHNTGVRTNGDATSLDQSATLQKYLHDDGYWTGILGKYLNRWDINDDPPSFDRWAIFTPEPGYWGVTYNSNGAIIKPGGYSTDYLSSRIGPFLQVAEGNDARPWFLMVTPFAPHYPYQPEGAYATSKVPGFFANPAVNETDRSDKPQYVRDRFVPLDTLKTTRANQLRTLMSVDDLVDNAFDQMNRFGEAGRTIVFYLSDNGFMWREHGITGKSQPYSNSIKVPFYMWGPSRGIARGAKDSSIVAIADIMPTILDLAGIEPDPEFPVDGRPLLGSFSRNRILTEYWQEGANDPVGTPTWASIRTATYQYVEYYALDGTTIIDREYYNLASDPWQNLNLLGDASTANDPNTDSVEAQLDHDRTCVGTTGGSACP
jgi:arylsulfatase A-like enzyme